MRSERPPASQTPVTGFGHGGPRPGQAASSVPETMGDPASGPESLDCSLGQDQEPFRRLGLTKEVLAAHTQKEEQSFLLKFKETRRLSVLQSRCHYYLQERSKGQSAERSTRGRPAGRGFLKHPERGRVPAACALRNAPAGDMCTVALPAMQSASAEPCQGCHVVFPGEQCCNRSDSPRLDPVARSAGGRRAGWATEKGGGLHPTRPCGPQADSPKEPEHGAGGCLGRRARLCSRRAWPAGSRADVWTTDGACGSTTLRVRPRGTTVRGQGCGGGDVD